MRQKRAGDRVLLSLPPRTAPSPPSMSAKMLPHIILMLADDLGNYEIGYHNPRALTPNIDSLAATGVILERHYVYHLCAPTRASTLSGRLPYHVNQQRWR